MKTKITILKKLVMFLATVLVSIMIQAQAKTTIAIVNIDSRNLTLDNAAIANLVRLELEKTNMYEIKDKYDMTDIIDQNNIDINKSFGKNKQIQIGKTLQVDKMLTGSAEKFGEKIIIILRLINVETGVVEKTDVMEYLDQQNEMQTMIKLSVNNLLGIPNDPNLVNLLINYDKPITSAKTTVKLNGPRTGFAYTTGNIANRLGAPKSEGGYNMFPVTSLFGYQFEKQYLSSGQFQALIELIGMINGLESGTFSPSITFINGFRFNKSGFEFGIGPVFRVIQYANGYYDEENNWHLESEMPVDANYPIEQQIDNRGDYELSTGLIVAIGRTFKSGYLNVPVNLYFSPKKEGSTIGFTIGFNVAKSPKLN
jgi:hypothetical protein